VSFLAPLFFYAALGVATVTAALHFIVTRQPVSRMLPTARFVPRSTVRVTTIAPPQDLLLLAARVLAILALGAAFARPVILPRHRTVTRIVLADDSRAVGNIASVRDSARALLRDGDALVVFDSSAHVSAHAADTLAHLARSTAEGRLSSALIVALREASRIRAGSDSIELVLVSPLRAREFDGATMAIRGLWPGRIRIVSIAVRADSSLRTNGVAVRAAAGDPILLAASIGGLASNDTSVRLARDGATLADSRWAAAGARTLIRWPATSLPTGWTARARADTATAVVAGDAAFVYPLERRWQVDTAGSARVVARWIDGTPAAVERSAGAGCVRDVAIPVPARGDVMLRPSFARLMRALLAPCALLDVGPAAGAATLAALRGSGPLASTHAIRPADTVATPMVPWLLALGLLLLLAELWMRRSAAAHDSARVPSGVTVEAIAVRTPEAAA
jgi:Aerotolerance regulator N-terminal